VKTVIEKRACFWNPVEMLPVGDFMRLRIELEPGVKLLCRTWDWCFSCWPTRTRDALSHGAGPISIHERVGGPYPAWTRISGYSSISRQSSATNFHQLRLFVNIEKSVI
jgi:hypothetical protein